MKKHLRFILLLCFFILLKINFSQAQNLVPNPSFEQYTSCPTGNSLISYATPWDVCPGSGTTPDYFHTCATPGTACNDVNVPDNFCGTAPAASGDAYAAIISVYDYCSNCREYIQAPLNSALVAGTNYLVQMYIRPGDYNKYMTDHLGIYLSTTAINQPGNQPITTVTPQVESALVISDTSIWTLVSGTYLAAGGEQYITIGNFHDNTNTNVDTVNYVGGSCALVTAGAMYMIDSVYVGISTNPNAPIVSFTSSDTSFCEKNCIDFYDQSTNTPTSWQWTFTGGSPSSSTLQDPTGICYNAYGTYQVKLVASNSFGSDSLVVTSFITVFASPPNPGITLSNDTFTSTAANAYQWYFNSAQVSGATNQTYVASQTGNYYVIITDSNGCSSASGSVQFNVGIDEFSVFNLQFAVHQVSPSSFIISLPGISGKNIGLNIFNSIGEKIYSSSEKNSSGKFSKQIDLTGEAKGIYFLQISVDERMINRKIFISH